MQHNWSSDVEERSAHFSIIPLKRAVCFWIWTSPYDTPLYLCYYCTVCGIRNPLTTPQHNSLDVFRTIYHPVGDDDVVWLHQTVLNGNLRGVSIHEKPEIIDFNHKSMKNETNSFYTLLFRRNSTNKFHFCSSTPLAYIMLTATCRVLVKSPNWITVNVDCKLYEI